MRIDTGRGDEGPTYIHAQPVGWGADLTQRDIDQPGKLPTDQDDLYYIGLFVFGAGFFVGMVLAALVIFGGLV